MRVFEVERISSVVAMVPHSVHFMGPDYVNRFFAVEKPGLAAATLGGAVERDVEVHGEEDADDAP